MEFTSKAQAAHYYLRQFPVKWFGDAVMDDRDRALLAAEQVSFVDFNRENYLRKIVGSFGDDPE